MDEMGLLFAISSAFLLGSNKLAVRKSLLKMDESFASFISILLAIPIFGLPLLIYGTDISRIPISAVIVFAGAGILNFSLGRYCIWKCISTIGANRGNIMASSQVLYAVAIAILFLHQTVDLLQGTGIALVMFGILLISFRGFSAGHFTPQQLKTGTFFGITGGLLWGVSQVLMQIGISLFKNATTASFITYLAAIPGVIPIIYLSNRYSKEEGGAFRIDRYSLGFVIIAAMLGNFGLFFRYLSLQTIPLTIVSTINGTNPMITLVLSYFLIRNLEHIDLRTTVGLVLSVIGVLLMSH
ncbi:MAG: DMT family transporter [Nitrososphaerota archaeon]|nr:DMT family transporter [Nitrososphaerota archaeon]